MTVVREDGVDPETAAIRYRRASSGWEVQTPADSGFRSFARPEAHERDIRQLIAKTWDSRYGEPDPFETEVTRTTEQAGLDDLGAGGPDDDR